MTDKEIIKELLDRIQEQSDEIARLKILLHASNNKTSKVTADDLQEMFDDADFWDVEAKKPQDTELSRKQDMIDDNYWKIKHIDEPRKKVGARHEIRR